MRQVSWRKVRWMRFVLALFLILSFVACGGGESDDDATPTNAPAAPTATSAPAAMTTTTGIPTSTSSPQANATNQPGGGIQQATAVTNDPTPTRRPVTVVTTPRPIAKTPTPLQIFATATVAEDDDGLTLVVDDLFDDPASTTFFTGETDYGTIAAIENGRYSLAVPESSWQSIAAVEAGDLGNAAILVEAGMDGDGAIGVVGRSFTNDDGTWNFYVCWLAVDGRAGCHVSISSEWTQLFIADAGTIPVQDVNTLILSVDDDLLTFSVNDTLVGTINDGTSLSGTWGVYAESFSGTAVGWFERVTIVTYDE